MHPIRCWLNPLLFCVSVHYTSDHLDAFEVYLGCSHRAVPGWECRLEHRAAFGQFPAHSCVLSKIATTKGCPLPSPRFIICSEAATESQNGWSWNSPLQTAWSSTPAQSRVKQRGCLGQCSGFEYLQGWRHHSPPGKHIPVFAREIKPKIKNAKPFLWFKWSLQYFNECLLSCHWKEPGLVFYCFPSDIYMH